MEEQEINFQKIEKQIEGWFEEQEVGFEKIEPGFWGLSFTLKETNQEYPLGVVVVGEPPFAVKVLVELGNVPPGNQWAFFRRMLEMNFSEVPGGAFAVNDINNKVYFIDRINIKVLDKDQLMTSIDNVIYAASDLKSKLSGYIL